MRRPTAVLAALAAALTASTLVAPSAHAQVVPVGLISDAKFWVQASAYASGTGCSVSSSGTTESTALPADGTSISRTLTRSDTSTDGGGKITALNRSTSANARVTTNGGRLSTLELRGTGFATADPQPGHTCYSSTFTGGGTEFVFTLTEPQWVSATLSTGRQTEAWVEAWEEDGASSFVLDAEGTGGTASGAQYLPPGTYEFNAGIAWSAWALPGGPGMDRSGTGSVSVRLHDPGSAFAAAAGTGRRYLVPGPAVTCSARNLAATFTARGARVRSATFFVNGVQKRVVRNPSAGQRVRLTGLPAVRRNDVRVRMVVDPPGPVRSATVSVTRSYRACAPGY